MYHVTMHPGSWKASYSLIDGCWTFWSTNPGDECNREERGSVTPFTPSFSLSPPSIIFFESEALRFIREESIIFIFCLACSRGSS
jgi:hypothetical protein